jgi:hypothetical protein
MGQGEPDQPAFKIAGVEVAFGGQLGKAGEIRLGRAEEAKV